MKKILYLIVVVSLLLTGKVYSQGINFPYFCGFEDPVENANWTIVNNDTCLNKWVIGNAVANEGKSSLYISSDNGATASYVSSSGFVAAYRTVTLPAGTGRYQIAFDWKALGTNTDRMYVCWLTDPSIDIQSSSQNALSTWVKSYAVPWISKDTVMMGSSMWQHGLIEVPSTGVPARLVFVWTNATSSKSASLGGCIDNVQIGSKSRCAQPANLEYKNLTAASGVITWQSGASTFDVKYKNNNSAYWTTHNGVSQTSDTISSLTKGVYTIWVRSVCGNDTSIWAVLSNLFIYVSSDMCIDYINLKNSPAVVAQNGTFTNPANTTGVVDNGPASATSRQTVHIDPYEYDPRTDYKLKTIPDGEVASVRLGNWTTGGEAERLTYSCVVDSTMSILLLKYAVVLENPGHTETDQPRFTLKIYDDRNMPIDPMCGAADFIPSKNTAEWHKTGTTEWKDWTTLGLNMKDQIGKKIKIELTTYDCDLGGHYGYAYLVLDCASARISGLTCGDNTVEALGAPEGFTYQWYKKDDPGVIVSTSRTFTPALNDTSDYQCKLTFLENKACYFTLDASLLPKWPKAVHSHNITYADCQATVTFQNDSYIYSRKGIVQGEVSTYMWDLGDGTQSSLKNPTHVYTAPGKYPISLTVGMADDQCIDIKLDTIVIKAFGDSDFKIERDICEGDVVVFDGKTYNKTGVYTNRYIDIAGCDSVRTLDLRVWKEFKESESHLMCQGDKYDFHGRILSESGIYVDTLLSRAGCDSIITLDLKVRSQLSVEILDHKVCADDPGVLIPYQVTQGGILEYEILFDQRAQKAGFQDVAKTSDIPQNFEFALPDGIKPNYYDLTFRFHAAECGVNDYPIRLTVEYPSSVMIQKWDDVLALLNKDYNGGYEYSSYQWYKNGMPLSGENKSYIYVKDKLDLTAEYRVELTRTEDSVTLFTCPFVPEMRSGVYVYPTYVKNGQQITITTPIQGRVEIWNTLGLQVGVYEIRETITPIEAPSTNGVYVVKVYLEDGTTRSVQILVQ